MGLGDAHRDSDHGFRILTDLGHRHDTSSPLCAHARTRPVKTVSTALSSPLPSRRSLLYPAKPGPCCPSSHDQCVPPFKTITCPVRAPRRSPVAVIKSRTQTLAAHGAGVRQPPQIGRGTGTWHISNHLRLAPCLPPAKQRPPPSHWMFPLPAAISTIPQFSPVLTGLFAPTSSVPPLFSLPP